MVETYQSGRALAAALDGSINGLLEKMENDVREMDASDSVKHRGFHLALIELSKRAYDRAQKHQAETARKQLMEMVGLDI